MSIYVTKSFLPPLEEYLPFLHEIWRSHYLTNGGPFLTKFEQEIKKYLRVETFHYVSNGTIALQLALRALEITSGEIITTPFSYVATTSSILWEHCSPVFVDIEPNNFCIDYTQIEAAITPKTKAILAVHVFGYACNIHEIQAIADKYNLKVIYDGAHAFGSWYQGQSLLAYGDIATVSFHATKLFHTVEGGGCIIHDNEVSKRLDLLKRFGHNNDEHLMLGINAKNSELHAAMGLTNLPHLTSIIEQRRDMAELYDRYLSGAIVRPMPQDSLQYNYAYYPVLFKTQDELLQVISALNNHKIFPRRYFYPSLNKLPYLYGCACPVSEDIASRIACLPIYIGLVTDDIKRISNIICDNLN